MYSQFMMHGQKNIKRLLAWSRLPVCKEESDYQRTDCLKPPYCLEEAQITRFIWRHIYVYGLQPSIFV